MIIQLKANATKAISQFSLWLEENEYPYKYIRLYDKNFIILWFTTEVNKLQ